MRKFILVCFLFSLFRTSYSQKYQPIDSTLIWNTRNSIRINSGFCCYAEIKSSFQFQGYVLNNGNIWLGLYESAIYSNACPMSCPNLPLPSNFTNGFVGYISNDTLNKKVYFTNTLTTNFTPSVSNLVYDFLNKNIGDSLAWKSVNYSNSP